MFNKLKDKKKLFVAAVKHNIFSFLVFLILMGAFFCLADLHVAILQKMNLRYNYVVLNPMILTVTLKYM